MSNSETKIFFQTALHAQFKCLQSKVLWKKIYK